MDSFDGVANHRPYPSNTHAFHHPKNMLKKNEKQEYEGAPTVRGLTPSMDQRLTDVIERTVKG